MSHPVYSAPVYEVRRHGGRRSDTWRTVLQTASHKDALDAFDSEVARLRQGGVELWFGSLRVRHAWSPRARSRW